MTAIKIRVQAKGGMFLGPDSSNGAFITLKDVDTGKILSSGFTTNGDSGQRLTAYESNSSFSAIVTPGKPEVIHWLTASDSTAVYVAELKLTEPTLIEFSASVPLPEAQGNQHILKTEWISPHKNPSPGPGLVLEIPGLWVQPEVAAEGNQVRIRAKVTMMCGCEVNENSPWIPSDFQVSGKVKNGKMEKSIDLDFSHNSQFFTEMTLDQKGEYEVEITGYQISTGNTGVARTKLTIN